MDGGGGLPPLRGVIASGDDVPVGPRPAGCDFTVEVVLIEGAECFFEKVFLAEQPFVDRIAIRQVTDAGTTPCVPPVSASAKQV